MTVRAIIADDEPLARERIGSLLAGEPDVAVVAECVNGARTLQATQEHRPAHFPFAIGHRLSAIRSEAMPR